MWIPNEDLLASLRITPLDGGSRAYVGASAVAMCALMAASILLMAASEPVARLGVAFGLFVAWGLFFGLRAAVDRELLDHRLSRQASRAPTFRGRVVRVLDEDKPGVAAHCETLGTERPVLERSIARVRQFLVRLHDGRFAIVDSRCVLVWNLDPIELGSEIELSGAPVPCPHRLRRRAVRSMPSSYRGGTPLAFVGTEDTPLFIRRVKPAVKPAVKSGKTPVTVRVSPVPCARMQAVDCPTVCADGTAEVVTTAW